MEVINVVFSDSVIRAGFGKDILYSGRLAFELPGFAGNQIGVKYKFMLDKKNWPPFKL